MQYECTDTSHGNPLNKEGWEGYYEYTTYRIILINFDYLYHVVFWICLVLLTVTKPPCTFLYYIMA